MAREDNNPMVGLSSLIFGVVLGGIAALLFGTNEKGETKDNVKKKVKDVKDKMRGGETWMKDKAAATTASVTAAMNEARTRVTTRVNQIRDRFGEVDKTKYAEAVGEVMEHMRGVGTVTADQVKTIRKYLMDDYQTLTSAPKKTTRKARQ